MIVTTYAGIASLFDNNTEQAKDYFAQASQTSQDSAYSKLGGGYLAKSKEDMFAALREIDEIIARKPDFSDAYLLKAYLLQGSKQYSDAAETFESYLLLRPKESATLLFIAQNYVRAKKTKLA